jgi:hypothetical protein
MALESEVKQNSRSAAVGSSTGRLERGRESYARRAWGDAYEALSLSDREAELAAGDLELLATSAYMIGREDEWMRALERARHVQAFHPGR